MSEPSVLSSLVFSSSRPPFHSSLFEPSKSVMAPVGGFCRGGAHSLLFFMTRPLSSERIPLEMLPKWGLCPSGGNFLVALKVSGDPARYLLLPSAGLRVIFLPLSFPVSRLCACRSIPLPADRREKDDMKGSFVESDNLGSHSVTFIFALKGKVRGDFGVVGIDESARETLLGS